MDASRTERSTGKSRTFEPTPAATDLLSRCHALLDELSAFQDFAAARKSKSVDIRNFKSSVQSEERSLLKLAEADQAASQTIHNLRSSNLPFYEAVWETAKFSPKLSGLQKRFYWNKTSHTTAKGKQKKKSALVDIVADNGSLWIKVSTITESKLLFEKAKAGWEADEWNASSDDQQAGRKILADGAEPKQQNQMDDSDDESLGLVELVKVARDLRKASLATRIHFKHPSAIVVLPNVDEGVNSVVDGILADIRSAGIAVRCGKQAHEGSLPDTFEKMMPVFRPPMTGVVNLDCTVLLALISDLSHQEVDQIVLPEKPHPSLLFQVDIERATPLLPAILYPGLDGAQKLVTSARSAARMWDIVRIIGTSTEHERARVLFGMSPDNAENVPASLADPESLVSRLETLSVHGRPALALPVEIIQDGINTVSGIPPKVLGRVSGQLSDINRSVFLLGWTNSWTTVTSNQTAVKTIEATITDELDRIQGNEDSAEEQFTGPLIWTIEVARSLVGKESGRAQ